MSIGGPKKTRGRPRIDSEAIKPRIAQPDLGALDRWIADQPDPKPSRADGLRLALRDWLVGLGYLPHRDDLEMSN